jgi:hypothetical protein
MAGINCWELHDLVPEGIGIQRKIDDDSHKQVKRFSETYHFSQLVNLFQRIKDALSDTVFMTRLRQSIWDAISVKWCVHFVRTYMLFLSV